MSLSVVILAAGQGTRMRSARPKVLHAIAGRPMLAHVLEAASALAPSVTAVVYGHGGDQVRAAHADWDVQWVLQAEQRGTGHAVAQALPVLPRAGTVLVLYGDVPLTRADTLRALVEAAGSDGLGLLTATLADPQGYGRIVRDAEGEVARIVEEKDASAAERALREINTGLLALPAARLAGWIEALSPSNAQGEYYLTDVIRMAVESGVPVRTVSAAHEWEILGVNSKAQLAALERVHQHRQAAQLLAQGVTLADPQRFDLRGTLTAGRDVEIDVGVVLEGRITLGDGVRIGPYCVLRDVEVGAGTEIQPHSVIEQAAIGAGCRIGPFARIRPETRLADHAHVGNFVEIKKSDIGSGTKINHLSYVGDATVGRNTNIGAGTITCNYDGANKHRTVIGDDVFVGSDTQLVAPVSVGDGATLGAGATITKDVAPGTLAISRAPQKSIAGWKRPAKKK